MPAPLTHRTLSSAIVERLRQSILGGERAAGGQLRQDALAAELGVSRIPVREALFQLEAEGLVRIEPHKGAVVAGFALAEIDDVFDLRVLLEPRLLARSVPRLQAADYAEIDALDAAFAEAIARHDVAQWGELNARLHLSLYRHAALPRTLAIVAALLQASDRYTRVQLSRNTGAGARAARTPALDRAQPAG
ncbi:MAG: GntR family transcriptional regulator [Rubrivivax sp.]